jgi:hypothetical protein
MFIREWIINVFSKSVELFFSEKLKKPTIKEIHLIHELRENLELIPQISQNEREVENEWGDFVKETIRLLNSSDPRKFLHFDVIKRTMVVGNTNYVNEELKYLKSRNWIFWKKNIRESHVGCPAPFPSYPKSSANLIHHGYHCAMFEEQMKFRISDVEYIFEFGGGYGSFCRLIYNMGYVGEYTIFDLPVFSCLQTYYLKMLGLNVYLNNNLRNDNSVNCVYDIEKLEETISINQNKKRLFVATWSISESPLELRNKIIRIVDSFDYFLMGYQNDFGSNDNISFFDKFCEERNDFEWKNIHIDHIPGNYYLFGKKLF